MNDIFSGDPAIFIDENGADMKFIGGQPVMDQGLENAVVISLFTKPGWWGNILETEDAKQIGSDFQDALRQPITISSLADVENAASRAVRWMDKKGIAKNEISSSNPSGSRIDTTVQLRPMGSDVQELRVSQNGNNWKAQASNPAHARR